MDGGCPPQVYMSRGAFIPPMVCAWSMHGPFVEHARVPGHSHSLHNHPGGPQDNGTMSSSCHAWLPPSTPPPPLPSSLSSPSCTRCTPKCGLSASPRAGQHKFPWFCCCKSSSGRRLFQLIRSSFCPLSFYIDLSQDQGCAFAFCTI